MANKSKEFEIILLRDKCPKLEEVVNLQLLKDPKYYQYYASAANLNNSPISIRNDWHTLEFIVVKKFTSMEDLKVTDILLYMDISLRRPTSIGNEINLLSFTNHFPLTLKLVNKVLDHVYDVYNVNLISFSCCEHSPIHRICELLSTNKKLAKKYFPTWDGRQVGILQKAAITQDNKVHNKILLEIYKDNKNIKIENET